ncbi:Regulatory protein RecX [subsurface metagenome]
MGNGAHGENSNSPRDNLIISSVKKGGTRAAGYKVNFSDGSSFFLLNEILLQEGLVEGDEITADRIALLKEKSSSLEVQKKALDLLTRAPHSTQTLKLKLLSRGYAPEIIASVLERLIELSYLDDRLFAEEWLRSRLLRHPEGRSALLAGLLRRGIAREIAEDVTDSIFTIKAEEECARRLMDKLKDKADLSEQELTARLLARRFRYRVIRELIAEAEQA